MFMLINLLMINIENWLQCFFLRTLHSFSCSWPTTNNGFRSDVLAGYSVKMFQLRRSDKVYFDQIRILRLVRAWLLHGLPGLDCWRESAAISCFLRCSKCDGPALIQSWVDPPHAGWAGGILLTCPSTGVSFGVDELRTLISALRQNPPTLQFSHYNFLLVARVRVLNIVSGRGFKFTIDHIFQNK